MNSTTADNRTSFSTRYFTFSWGPVFAGVFVTLSIQIALSVLGTACGMAAVKPTAQYNPVSGLSHFGFYWWILSGLISLALGSFVAAHLSYTDSEFEGETVGFVTWSVVNVIGVLIVLITAGGAMQVGGKIIGGTLSTVVSAGSNIAPTLADQVKQYLPAELKEINTNVSRSELDVLMKGNSKSDPALTEAFDRMFNRDSGGIEDPSNKEVLANLIASRTSVSHDDALNSINKWQASYADAKAKFDAAKVEAEQKARVAAEKAAKATSTGAFIIFATLMLGLATSLYAGRLGAYYRNPEVKLSFLRHHVANPLP